MAESVVHDKALLIHLWTGPRSLSTCTMYSFSQRSDTEVLDEPLYASWLARNPHIYRPYREELLAKGNCDGNHVLKEMADKVSSGIMGAKKILLAKHVAKQFSGLDKELLFNSQSRHVFIVRDPIDMIDGWQRRIGVHQENPSLETLCLPLMCELYSNIRSRGEDPIVIDADILQQFPREVLSIVCKKLGVSFDEKMLSWEPGPKPEIDGLWAPYWYKSVHESSGFVEGKGSRAHLVSEIELIRDAMPFYDMLRRRAIGRNSLNPGSSFSVEFAAEDGVKSDTVLDHGLALAVGRQTLADPRNANILVWLGDRLVPREHAKVSVFDSAVQGGDAVWEGLRVYNSKVFKLDEHIQRLFDSAKAMGFKAIPTSQFIKNSIFTTLLANGMSNGAHIRLTLSRGPKLTSSMNPTFNVFGSNLIVLPEWKPVGDVTTYNNAIGIRLVTACNRRNPAQCVDSKIHHCNLINNILPKIQANNSGAADALMLDLEGFVSETNATNVFMVKHGVVMTPTADSCLPGVTRGTIIELCKSMNIPIEVRRISLSEFYAADEVFTTGTMGELTPVYEIDGRTIGNDGVEKTVTKALQVAYATLTETEGVAIEL